MSTIRDAAVVTVGYVIDGRRPRKAPAHMSVREAHEVTVNTAVLAAARAALRPDQRLVIVGPDRIDVVNLSNVYTRERTARRKS